VKYLATALAPAISPIRFRLHFFRIDLAERHQFTIDTGEIAAASWQTPQQLLDSFAAGDALMVPPLRWMLKQLHQNPTGDNFGDLSPQFDEDLYVPKLELLSGLRMLPVPSNTFPPEKRTTAYLLGDDSAPKILVDPSPESPPVLKKLLRTLWLQDLTAIFLTHHHHDHHEHAPALATQLKLPIWMSEDTHNRITKKYGSDYFAGVQIGIKQAGDCLTTWKSEPVRVYAIPGHDAGQLGLAPESLRWFLVGDLIQSFGTVVISAPEGDMATYFQTLKQLISMDPAVIVPSHGMPMRSTFRLQATLQHRCDREIEIHAIHNSGKTKAEILDIVYPQIDPRLAPFAMCNIESHLTKLRQEGHI
ncbi:MAG: MBL fold metallo-hydrolase, partial [Desulfuromonadales bacterium]|nr:MBL fold metallo-hydrolase [Desulfuromonadales bacterium]